MAAADWDRSGGVGLITHDDTTTENLLGLNLLVTSAGELFVDTAVSQADMWVETDFYHALQVNNAEVLIGARLDKATGDGYYAGLAGTALPATTTNSRVVIYKKDTGVFTQLANLQVETAKPVDTLSTIQLRIEGSSVIVYYTIDGVFRGSLEIDDSTFAAAGSAGVLSVAPAGFLRVKNFEVSDI